MDIDLALPVIADRTFTVESEHTTTIFGDHAEPPARPAAHDATDGEAREVLGTPQLLSVVEFCARDSLHGRLPDGTGTVGERATVAHRGAALIGTELVVETGVVAVDGPRLAVEGVVRRADAAEGDGVVGEVECTFRVVERERFLASLGSAGGSTDDPATDA